MMQRTSLLYVLPFIASVGLVMAQQPTPPRQPSEIGVVLTGDPGTPPRLAVPDFLALSNDKETQEIARAYGAVCTPDFFGFNANMKLQYRGRLDGARPGHAAADLPRELFAAMRQIARSGEGPIGQTPAIGCSIKWREAAR